MPFSPGKHGGLLGKNYANLGFPFRIEKFKVLPEPIQNLGEAKFVPPHRALDEPSISGFDFQVEAVAAQEDIGAVNATRLLPS
jgi:hypothetical protein